jgi:hypothetical protein
VLLETFVEKARFAGACYRTTNWICLGETQGRGKRDLHHHRRAVPVKAVFVYPLARDCKEQLTS